MFERTFSFWRRLMGTPLTNPTGDSDTAVEDERRLWVRHATDLQGRVQSAAKVGGQRVLAGVQDLSRGGARLVVDHLFETGEMLTVELPCDQGEARTFLACVVRVTPEDDRWSLGCVFARELSERDLGAFGARREPAGTSDQRVWVRFDCDVRATCRKFGEPVSDGHAVQVLNISATGIGLVLTVPEEAGRLLNVDLFDKNGRKVCGILACIVHTTQRGGGDHAIGCNFIRELTEEELEALL